MEDIVFETAVVFTGHMGYPGGRWKKTCFVQGKFDASDDSLKTLEAIGSMYPHVEWDRSFGESCDIDKYEQAHMHRVVQTYPVLRIGEQRFALTAFVTDEPGCFPPSEISRDDE